MVALLLSDKGVSRYPDPHWAMSQCCNVIYSFSYTFRVISTFAHTQQTIQDCLLLLLQAQNSI
jgi:hypothetical protein